MKKRSQWPFPTLLDAVSAFEYLSHKHRSRYNTTANTTDSLTFLIVTVLIYYLGGIFAFIHHD